jgi:glycosyltransferase involved in cell wall biosynthesis
MSSEKVLIYGDSPNWAYDTIIQSVRNSLGDRYDIYWDYTLLHHYQHHAKRAHAHESVLYKLKHNIKHLISVLIRPSGTATNYVPFFNYIWTPFWIRRFIHNGVSAQRRVLPFWCAYDCVVMLDYYFDHVAHLDFRTKATIKGIYIDGFPPCGMTYDFLLRKDYAPNSKEEFFHDYLEGIDALVIGAPKIASIYSGFDIPMFFATSCFDTELFKRRTARIKAADKRTIIIGWTGNPDREFKRFYQLIKPFCEDLIAKGQPIRLVTRFEGPLETLPSFYEQVDVVIIASLADAGPSLFMEAALMDVPCISTRIGFPDHVIEDGVNGWFFDGSEEDLNEKMQHLLTHPHLIDEASEKIRRDYLSKMGPEVMAKAWDDVIQYALNRHR